MKQTKKYEGVIVPMITPLTSDYLIDEHAVENLLGRFFETGITPFILGTTGEAPSMSPELRRAMVKMVLRVAGDRHTVFAGISGNAFSHSAEEASLFADWGIRAVVSHLPWYYPIEPDHMLRYFEKLADLSHCPLILYNMPATTGLSIPVEIVETLSHHPNIIGIKDSERDMERLDRSLSLWSGRADFSFYVGWAAQSVYGLRRGAAGIVPSTANVTPGLYKELADAVGQGHSEEAEALQKRTDYYSSLYQKGRKLNQSLPALKLMLSGLGVCEPHVLPPLYREPAEKERAYLDAVLPELEKLYGK
ncbi:MAG: dihydrodipicolinate synthase family protein [Bacteroidales bacterium]|nr:dihydrodipicolinate synthase family protein [Bacteroidales bacterium]